MPYSRRRFVASTSFALGSSALPASSLLAAQASPGHTPFARVTELRIISQQPTYYHGWATLTKAPEGTLYVAYSGGRDGHVCPFGRVELIRSHDEGRTWTWPEVVMDSAIDDRDAGMCVTPKGSLLVTTFTSLAYERVLEKSASDWHAERRGRWVAAHERVSAEERKSLLGTWMLRSADGGLTWSAPYRVPLNSPHGPTALQDGRLIYAGRSFWSEPSRMGIAVSSDDGQSWDWLCDLPVRPGDTLENYHELHAVQAKSGKIIVHIRNHNDVNRRETLQCESTDLGRTWSTPHEIGVWGLPSHLLRLQDDRLLMSYSYRRKPHGNQARISSDEGKTWGTPLTLSDDSFHGDLGYPSTVELKDGSLYSVWYEQLASSPMAVLRAARWKLQS